MRVTSESGLYLNMRARCATSRALFIAPQLSSLPHTPVNDPRYWSSFHSPYSTAPELKNFTPHPLCELLSQLPKYVARSLAQ